MHVCMYVYMWFSTLTRVAMDVVKQEGMTGLMLACAIVCVCVHVCVCVCMGVFNA